MTTKQHGIQIPWNILLFFSALTIPYLIVMLCHKSSQRLIEQANNKEDTDSKVRKALAKYFYNGSLRNLPSVARFFIPIKQNVEDLIAKALADDNLSNIFLNSRRIINPLYLAYMRLISRKIYEGAEDLPCSIVYSASNVDIITPLLLLMASPSKEATIYMIDIKDEIRKKLDMIAGEMSHTHEINPLITSRLYDQFLLLSVFNNVDDERETESYLILSFLLRELGITSLKIDSNKLIFEFQNRTLAFKFITADIKKLDESATNDLQEVKDKPYIYVEKAAVDLSRESCLPRLFGLLGSPKFCIVNTKKMNNNFTWFFKFPSLEDQIKDQFVPNKIDILTKISDSDIEALKQAMKKLSRMKGIAAVTGYHLPALHSVTDTKALEVPEEKKTDHMHTEQKHRKR